MLKLVERFYSLQGEGVWAGFPMYFARTYGCPVGGMHGWCESASHVRFICDTGPRYTPHTPNWISYLGAFEEVDEKALWEEIPPACTILCLTGGEPFIYNLKPLVESKPKDMDVGLHIETSGTVPKPDWLERDDYLWITLSPKKGFHEEWLHFANECKVLVGPQTNAGDLTMFVSQGEHVCLQPIQSGDPVETADAISNAIKLCKAIGIPLSIQQHKYLSIR